jgi:hypothetical protein
MASPGALARTIVAGALAGLFSATLSAAPLDCEKLKVSVQPEPPGYAAQCLGKSAAPPAAPQAPQTAPSAFYLNLRSGGTFGQQFLSAPFPSLIFTSVGPQTAPIFAMDFDNTATTLYAIDNASRNLGMLNTSTGAFTPLVTVTGVTGDTISGLAFDPTSGNAYISVTNGTPVTSASLYTLNITTGVATLLGPIVASGDPPAIVDIAFSNQGKLYAHDVSGDRILLINTLTGAVTEVGATGLDANFAQGMKFDPTTDILWMAGYLGGGQARLARINTLSGTATIVASSSNEELEMGFKLTPAQWQAYHRSLSFDDQSDILNPDTDSVLKPYWESTGTGTLPAGAGVITNFVGPVGGTYSTLDGTGTYPSIALGSTGTCTDCYTVRASGTRPQQHWDAGIVEFLPTPGISQGRDFHIGDSFSDVFRISPYYRFVETIFHHQITAGCTPGAYCPTNPVSREQMSVFVLVAKQGAGYQPPPCVPPNIFNDVPETSPYCKFVEELSRRQVVSGCGGGNFCPTDPVTREQMAVFVLRTLGGFQFTPPACTVPLFADVPASSPFCKFVEEMSRRQITSGCGPGIYCPTQAVTREQMAVFLSTAFGLYFVPPTPTPGSLPGLAGSASGGPSGGPDGDTAGLAFLLIGFASAIGLPIALRRPSDLRDPSRPG